MNEKISGNKRAESRGRCRNPLAAAQNRTGRKGCVLAFFSVVASYSNLSTHYIFGRKGKKFRRDDRRKYRD